MVLPLFADREQPHLVPPVSDPAPRSLRSGTSRNILGLIRWRCPFRTGHCCETCRAVLLHHAGRPARGQPFTKPDKAMCLQAGG